MKKIKVDSKVVFTLSDIERMPDKIQKKINGMIDYGKELIEKKQGEKDKNEIGKIDDEINKTQRYIDKLVEKNADKNANVLDFIIFMINKTKYYQNQEFSKQIEGGKIVEKVLKARYDKKDLILSDSEHKQIIEILNKASKKVKVQTQMGEQEIGTIWENLNWDPVKKPFITFLLAINDAEDSEE